MKKDPVRTRASFILGFLVVEYLLGITANLFITFPTTKDEWAFVQTQPVLILHILIAIFLIIGGIVLLIQAIRKKDRRWIVVGIVGLISLIGAVFGGDKFIDTQQNAYSYIMAIAFTLAFVSYGWGLYKSK